MGEGEGKSGDYTVFTGKRFLKERGNRKCRDITTSARYAGHILTQVKNATVKKNITNTSKGLEKW